MADSDKETEKVEATEEAENVETTEDAKEVDEAEVLKRDATEESDVKASAERRNESIIERGGKVAYASDVLKVSSKETDINPLDGKEIDKDSQFNPTRGI